MLLLEVPGGLQMTFLITAQLEISFSVSKSEITYIAVIKALFYIILLVILCTLL